MSRRGTQSNRAPKNLPIFGKRRKCGKPNSRASFFLQATSDEVVGVSRLTLLDCLTTWVYLDNTRTRMRVLFYMVICASFYLDFRLFKVRSLRSRGGEIPAFAHSARVFEHVSTTQTFLRLVAQHLLLQMHSMSITPECYSGAFSRKSTFLKIFLLIYLSYTLPSSAERTTAQLPANKKCCLLRLPQKTSV